jgi:uncharacterized protein YyaL (SSP411 family)
MIEYFWDEKDNGFFFTADDAESLIVRKKESYDGAIPSGNAVAMLNLLRLARLVGRPDLEEKAEKTGRAFSGFITKLPSAHTHFLVGLDFGMGPSFEVVIVGSSETKDTKALFKALNARYLPGMVTLFRPSNQEVPDVDKLVAFIRNYVSLNGKATAYVCQGNACKSPTTDIKQMLESLGSG